MTLGATVGRTFTKCRIELPEVGVITTGLQIRNSLTTTLQDNRTNRRLGCQFVDISSAHLSMVQRYVTNVSAITRAVQATNALANPAAAHRPRNRN